MLEDGKEQAIASFELVDIPVIVGAPPTAPIVDPDVASNAAAAEGRVYLIVLDDLHTHPLRSVTVRELAREFIERNFGPNDLGAIIATSSRREHGDRVHRQSRSPARRRGTVRRRLQRRRVLRQRSRLLPGGRTPHHEIPGDAGQVAGGRRRPAQSAAVHQRRIRQRDIKRVCLGAGRRRRSARCRRQHRSDRSQPRRRKRCRRGRARCDRRRHAEQRQHFRHRPARAAGRCGADGQAGPHPRGRQRRAKP